MTPQQIASVDALKIESAEFAVMRQLAMRFRGLLMGSSMEKLDVWLQDARLSGVYGMQRFARAARQDFDAVRNAILEPWSSGQTEGQINRLKILKRAMYERFHGSLEKAAAVVGIEDVKGGAQARDFGLVAKLAGGEAVVGAEPRWRLDAAERRANAGRHLLRGLVRESDGEDPGGRKAIGRNALNDRGR